MNNAEESTVHGVCRKLTGFSVFILYAYHILLKMFNKLFDWLGIILYFNMTVWILVGNYISLTIAAGLIRLHMPGVKKFCV